MMQYSEYEKWRAYISSQFDKFSTYLVACVLLFLIVFIPVHVAFKDDFDYEWLTFIISYLTLSAYWLWFKYKYPRNKNARTGLVIAVYAKDKDELALKNYFVKELKRNIYLADLGSTFNVIVLKNHLAQNVNDRESVDKLHEKVNGHIYYYGDVQEARDGENNRDFINISGYVKHRPIPIQTSKELGFDFAKLLPKEIDFESFFGLRGTKATARVVFLTTKYITGVASFLSGNPFLAYKLHGDLKEEIKQYENINTELKKARSLTEFDFTHISKIKSKLYPILSNELFVIARFHFEKNEMAETVRHLQLSLENNPTNYSTLLLKAVTDFTVGNNPQLALQTIKIAERHANGRGEWRYSKAFLLLWLEKYQDAWHVCQKISESSFQGEPTTIREVHDFNLQILQNHPDKIQLYFWLGFTQYKKAENAPMALKYLEYFYSAAHQDMEFLKEKANSYISEITRLIGIP